MDRKQIIELYELYGFVLDRETDDAIAFTFTNGYFNNVEIICFDHMDQIEALKQEYEQVGYSVAVKRCEDIYGIHNTLFNGFFFVPHSKIKHQNEYKKYCEKQSRSLFDFQYEYLNCDYTVNNHVVYNDTSVVDCLFDVLNKKGPQMVFLEAAAGFGKTCTTYEVLKKYAESTLEKVPLVTELSKNRKASLFRYVLLDEMDRQFSNLSSKVVIYEIQQGRVPLMIDGFDELLSKAGSSQTDSIQESFEEVQGMLDTIANLLKEDTETKILITSRKSAIFTGDQFDEWIDKRNLGSYITRVELMPPKVKDWIGASKYEILLKKKVNVNDIANPILLVLLRYQEDKYLNDNSINDILQDYFNKLLLRERVRQSLELSPKEQLDIMYHLAANFADFGISSEVPDYIRDMLLEITEGDIDEYILRYKNDFDENNENIPDKEGFVMKLVHHAFLDRVSVTKNQIGFINDFFFGMFLGYALTKEYIQDIDSLGFKYIDLISTAFAVNDMGINREIAEAVKTLLRNYTGSQQLEVSIKLYHTNLHDYKEEYFSNMYFSNGFHIQPQCFSSCIFSNCVFRDCKISDRSFYDCQFYNCSFYDNEYENCDPESPAENTLMFLECTGYQELIDTCYPHGEIKEEASTELNYEKVLLEQFWKIGKPKPEPRRAFTAVYKGVSKNNIPKMDEAIRSLLRKNILVKKNYCYELVFAKLKEIKEILGRD